MEKEIIKSYLLATHHLQQRASYDLSKKPELQITSIKKQDNIYHIEGIMFVNLGPACLEKNIFETLIHIEENKIELTSKIKAINQFISHISTNNKQIEIEGESKTHTDTFKIELIEGTKYLIHISDNTITKVYMIDNNYKLNKGIPKNLNIYKPQPKYKKRSRLRKIITTRQ